jgi:hypothetical protein
LNASLTSLLIGVAVAVTAFVAQQVVIFIVDGIRFRRRLTADVSLIVAGFRAWTKRPEVTVHNDGDPSHPAISMALIWDYSYESMDDLYSHAAHLPPELFARVVRFYSAAGRFDEIRRSYSKHGHHELRPDGGLTSPPMFSTELYFIPVTHNLY